MKNLLLVDGDLVLGKGDMLMVEGDAELVQTLRTDLGAAKGEWFLDEELGLDREPFETKPTNEEAIRTAVVETVMENPQIASVERVDITFHKETRILTIDFTAVKADGVTIELREVQMNGG